VAYSKFKESGFTVRVYYVISLAHVLGRRRADRRQRQESCPKTSAKANTLLLLLQSVRDKSFLNLFNLHPLVASSDKAVQAMVDRVTFKIREITD
jgi:hypothetical protein